VRTDAALTRVRVEAPWLALREPADSASRASDLAERARHALPRNRRPVVIHDLACGTGAMMRWLAPRLPGPQHWICHDLDADLLLRVEQTCAPVAADGSAVTVETRHEDVTRLQGSELSDAALITSSALLDLLTITELERFARSCAAAGCAVLVTTTVVGAVQLHPPHPLDELIVAAFNAHQCRSVGDQTLLGPRAAEAAVHEFARLGRSVVTRSSPWRLDASRSELFRAWLAGWLDAAREQEPGLARQLDGYARQRGQDIAAGRLRALVHHRDLLVLPEENTHR
jgi:hypothetical protein